MLNNRSRHPLKAKQCEKNDNVTVPWWVLIKCEHYELITLVNLDLVINKFNLVLLTKIPEYKQKE